MRRKKKTLGPYVIEQELGSGGMGKVYLAQCLEAAFGFPAKSHFALKVMHDHLQDDNNFERLLREAEVGISVVHPNVVRTYACGTLTTERTPKHFLVMEYVEGQTLGALLVEMQRMPEELCRHIGREVCKGLAAIHATGAIHRDIKPENVLITPDHVVKIMDLGVARSMNDALRLSQTGTFVGSLHYACPEQFKQGGKGLDGRVDLHALGLILYELAGGNNPYRGDDVAQTVQKVMHEEPRRLGEINPQVSAFFEEAVHCLLAKNRDERFETADELESVLTEGEDASWWHDRALAMQRGTRRPIRRIRIPRETAVYGRDTEIAKLRALYDTAKSGDGNVLLIEGEAGIGKSRLVDELIGRLEQDGEDITFLFGGYPSGGAATADAGFSEAYRAQFGEAGAGEYLPDNQTLVPAFDALLRGEGTPDGAQALNKSSMQTCFVRATHSLAKERMTLVLIDDLHFAPDEGRALFASLAMGVAGHRILLVGTTRPSVSEDWRANLTRLDRTTHLSLQRLGPKDLVHLLRDTLQSEQLAKDLGNQIAVKSDGNPFFVFEILQGLREGQFITKADDGTWVNTKVVENIEIPSSVLDLVKARVSTLTQEERDLLDIAACWGFSFDPGLLADVLGMRRIPLLKQLAQIERAHRLIRSSGRAFVFDHHQVQEALYSSLPEMLREEYHGALAEALETRTKAADNDPETLDGSLCVDLCDHYFKGARGESALRYLPAAQTHLLHHYFHAEVVALSERALAEPDLLAGVGRANVLLQLTSALNPLGLVERQEACAREAERLAETAGDEELRAEAVRALGECLWRTSRHAEAEAEFRRALEIAVSRGDKKLQATVLGNLGAVFQTDRRFAEAYELFERQLALSREIEDRLGEGHAMGNLGMALYRRGDLAEATQYFEQSLTLSRETGFAQGAASATGNLGLVCLSKGRHDKAEEYLESYLTQSREIGNRAAEAIALHNLGAVHTEKKAPNRAEERLLQCLAVSKEIQYRDLTAATLQSIGSLRAEVGNEAGAREFLIAARDMAAEIESAGVMTLARCELACLADGDSNDALEAFATFGARLSPLERRIARWHLWRATGDRTHLEEAKQLFDEAVADVDDETRESMLVNDHKLLKACEEQGV